MAAHTQAEWDKARKAAKAKAAKVVKANAEEALAAKRKALGQTPIAKGKGKDKAASEGDPGSDKKD
jgi:hypothetical protein